MSFLGACLENVSRSFPSASARGQSEARPPLQGFSVAGGGGSTWDLVRWEARSPARYDDREGVGIWMIEEKM